MSWEPELDELRRRTEMAKAMGGPEKVARQHEFGKLTVRERVERLVDPGSFDEIGTVAGVGQYDEAGGADRLHAVQLRVRSRGGRRPAGHRLG